MSGIELYGYGESVASNMARVAMSEKNISYKYNLIYLESKGDHLSKDYKKLNPKNLVPTMIDNGKVIPDSIEIMKHINSTYTQGTDLFPLNINLFLLALGGILYGGVGIASMLLGEEFLSYNVLGTSNQAGQHIGILLVEFGVGLTVSNVMIALFYAFADFKRSGETK